MKIKGNFLVILSVIAVLLLVLNSMGFAQEERKIKMDEYQAQLSTTQGRKAEADTEVTSLQQEIEDLKAQIKDVQNQIDGTWNDIYAMLGTDKAGVNAFRGDLRSIESEIDGLAAISSEELFKRKDEIQALEDRIAAARESKIAHLTEMDNKLASLDAKIANLKANLPKNIYDEYIVIKGDYLWKIAKKDDIYGDAYQWIRIYCVNKDQIKDPDLIFPEQNLKIARGVGMNEYLVQKGDWLTKIAGYANVYNDPTKWTDLYEANKDVISDATLIYPHMVLTVPQ